MGPPHPSAQCQAPKGSWPAREAHPGYEPYLCPLCPAPCSCSFASPNPLEVLPTEGSLPHRLPSPSRRHLQWEVGRQAGPMVTTAQVCQQLYRPSVGTSCSRTRFFGSCHQLPSCFEPGGLGRPWGLGFKGLGISPIPHDSGAMGATGTVLHLCHLYCLSFRREGSVQLKPTQLSRPHMLPFLLTQKPLLKVS